MRTRLALLLACATGFVLFSNCTRDQGVTSRDTTLAVRGRLEVPVETDSPGGCVRIKLPLMTN